MSENAAFAEVCEASGIKFIGPKPDVIRMMGIKERARAYMREMGVPVLPGSPGVLKSPEEAVKLADEIGYPVILKASAGGGGRGMRVVTKAEDLAPLFAQAQSEAGAAFSRLTCTWKNTSVRRATSSSNYSPTSTGMWRSWASATAASSVDTRSW